MSLYELTFYFFTASAAFSTLAIVFTRNVFYAALLLIACLLSVAALFVLAFAEFLAVTQIMVYAGGVLVLIIFGIMLTAKFGDKPMVVSHTNLFAGALMCLTVFVVLCYYFDKVSFAGREAAPSGTGSLEEVGMNLMTSHLIPFELAGILLLVALIGAAVVASHKSREV